MKKEKSKASKGSKRRQKVQKGQVGAGGVATAPRKLPYLELPPALLQKPGLGPESATPTDNQRPAHGTIIVPVSELEVAVAGGDDGNLYFLFKARGREKVVRSVEVTSQLAKVWGAIADLGVLATSKADKAAVKEMIDNPTEAADAIIATRSGYERNVAPRYFVYGDGSVITSCPDLHVYTLSPVVDGFSQHGSLKAYERSVSQLLRDQAVPLTVFLVGLSEILKPFVAAAGFDNQNMMIDLVGKSTSYKSALTGGIAGSAWGSADRHAGYARRWNMTGQKIEDFFRQFNGHLLILDEATLAHSDPKKRGDIVANVVFRLSSGMGRARTGEAEVPSHSLTVLSSSNDPMEKILAASPEGQEALGVRLVSFTMPNRRTKFFDSVPKGFGSVPEAMTANFGVTRDNHGLLARQLILDVLTWVNDDRDGLVAFIKLSMDKFLLRAGFDVSSAGDIEYRRVQPLAVAYATSEVAFKMGTLARERWGKPLKTILRAWCEYGRKRSTELGDPRFNFYMEDHSNLFVDARRRLPEIGDQEFADLAGFIHCGRDGAVYLSVSKEACSNRLGFDAAMLKLLKQQRILRAGKGLLTKLKLRRLGGKKRRDTFYRFRLSGVSPKIKFR